MELLHFKIFTQDLGGIFAIYSNILCKICVLQQPQNKIFSLTPAIYHFRLKIKKTKQIILAKNRYQNQGNHRHNLNQNIQRRADRILQRIADRIADHR